MVGVIGGVDAFDSNVEEWDNSIERLEQYCFVNRIENDRKMTVLLIVMGAKTYHLLRSLTAPQKPATKSFKNITKLLQDHFIPKPLFSAERFRFHNQNQQKNESLRDRLVCGMHNEGIQRRLLTEKDLTLAKALENALAMETVSRDAIELQKKVAYQCNVNKFTT